MEFAGIKIKIITKSIEKADLPVLSYQFKGISIQPVHLPQLSPQRAHPSNGASGSGISWLSVVCLRVCPPVAGGRGSVNSQGLVWLLSLLRARVVGKKEAP